jgi:cellulose synthase operon protein C
VLSRLSARLVVLEGMPLVLYRHEVGGNSAEGGGRVVKKLNLRPGVKALALLSLAFALAACGARLTADERVDLARTQLVQGDAATAAIHLRNVLQEDPTNVPARVLLAEAAMLVGDMGTAVKEYRRALDLGAELDSFRLAYAEALVRSGAAEEALQVTAPAEAGDSAPMSYWRAMALVRTGSIDEAEALFERVLQEPELRVRATIGLAQAAIARQRPEAALGMLEEVAGEAEDLSDYWEVLAIAAGQVGQNVRAAEAFVKAAATVVDAGGTRKFIYRIGEVEALLAAGQLPEARSRAERIHAQAREHPLANYVMGRLELQAGNSQQALAYGQAILASQPNSPQGHLMVGMAYLGLGQTLQAESSLERAIALEPDNMTARRLLAQTRLGMQAPERALEALGPITEESLDTGVASLAGMASVRAGDPAAAIEIFRRQLEKNPGDDEARSMLAVSLMAAGNVEEALAELAQISESDEIMRQRADLIEVAARLQAGALVEARETAARLAAEHPGDGVLRANLGGLFLSSNQIDDASAWLEEAVQIDPANVAAHFNLGRIAAAMGRLAAARGHFDAILEIAPTNGAALVALAQLDWAGGERESAVARLQAVRAAAPGDIDSRLLLAAYLATLNRTGESLEVAKEAVAAAPESASAANTLGAALVEAGKAGEAVEYFARAHSLQPGEAQYLFNKARAELASGQLDLSRDTLVLALALDPESLLGLAMMVEVERRLGRLDAAGRAFARLERAAPPGDARVEEIRGGLLLSQEDYAGAERSFRAALESGAGSRSVIGLYEARRRGGVLEPEQPLLDWLATHPEDATVRNALGAYYISTRDYRAAVGQYEKLLEQSPDNAMLLNNLAWLYSQLGEARALDLAERAHKLAPGNPMVADTLGWILHQRGNTARALDLIGKAAEAAPQVGEIRYHHAVLLAETGQRANAIRVARAVLADAAAANYHEPAQKLLDSLEKGGE